jgi:hypothetical protein
MVFHFFPGLPAPKSEQACLLANLAGRQERQKSARLYPA